MKLQTICEAKQFHNAKVAVHEVIGGRHGGISNHKSVVDMEKLIKYLQATATEDDDVLESDEMDDMPWSIGAVSYNYDYKEILNTIQKKRGWRGHHEEGTVGISTKGPAHARALAQAEWADDDSDEDEDWE